jgi:hypothetical protein
MKRKRPKAFSVTKAVKANARERVGQPRPEKVIASEGQSGRRKRRYKETLGHLLVAEE